MNSIVRFRELQTEAGLSHPDRVGDRNRIPTVREVSDLLDKLSSSEGYDELKGICTTLAELRYQDETNQLPRHADMDAELDALLGKGERTCPSLSAVPDRVCETTSTSTSIAKTA